jgi:hypothetical protein
MKGTLYESVMTSCHIIDKTTVEDGRGGVETVYIEGAKIDVAFSFDDSTPVVIADQERVTDLYTLITYKSVVLQAGDIIRRDKDQAIFKIEDNGDENTPPPISALDMRQVKAKKWSLPNG